MALSKEVQERIWRQGIRFSEDVKQRVAHMNGAKTEAERSASLLTTLESIKEDCKSKGIPMDLVLQSIYNKADKAVKGYYEQSK
jgi:hypothetical protein